MITQEHITNLLEAIDNKKILCIDVFCKGCMVSTSGAYGNIVNFQHSVENSITNQPMLNFTKTDQGTSFGANMNVIWIDDDEDIMYRFSMRGDANDVEYCNGNVKML